MKEKLSALMDGELDRKATGELLGALVRDSGLRCSWERWHLIRAALHQDLEETPVSGVATATADGLREEPTVLAPGGGSCPIAGILADGLAVPPLPRPWPRYQ
jgi:negative regulator of sigma E activity